MRWAAVLLLLPIVSFASPDIPTLRVEGDDGNVALQLTAVDVRVTVRGHLARTELALTYRNALDRQTEGELEFPLPADAEVSDVGLYFGEVLRRGVAVERALARTAYEQIVHARVDPALVEWNAGRTFKLRVYPIPANGEKTVFLAYDQELTGGDYELDLRWAREMDLDINVDAEGRAVHNDDGVLRVRREQSESALAARSPEDGQWYASAAIDVAAPRGDMPRAPHVVVLYDTSSSAIHQKSAVLRRFLESFLARQQELATVDVIPFHVTLAPAQRIERAGTPGGMLQLERVLANLQPLGATNLIGVAAELPRIVATLPTSTRVVLVTDGLTSLGHSRDVGTAVRKLGELRRPLTVVNAARSADALLLANAARSTGGWWLDLSQLDPDVAAADAMRIPARVQLEESLRPRSLLSVGDGRFAVAARANHALTTLRIGNRDLPLREVTDAKTASMIRRAWARAELREMLARGATDEELIAHGRAFTQVTPRTSLIVLETFWDYQRYGIPMPPDLVAAKAAWDEEQKRSVAETKALMQLPPSRVTPGGWWIEGRVLDSDGSPLPGVMVVLTDGGVPLVLDISDEHGRYVLGVPSPPKTPGVLADLPGFYRTRRQLASGVTAGASLNVTLQVAAISEAITVTASAPVVEVNTVYTAATVPPLRTEVISSDRLLSTIAAGEANIHDEELRVAAAKQRRELTRAVTDRLRGIGSTAEGVRYYVSARALLGGDKGFHVLAAEAFRERSPELAVRVLSDLAEAYPDDAPMLRILARVLEGWGEAELAKLLWQRATEIAPDQTEARRQIDPGDDITVEMTYDSTWSSVRLHILEPSGEAVSWETTQSAAGATFTFDDAQVYTLRNAPRGAYFVLVEYERADDTTVSLETLVHVVVHQRGRRTDHFLVLGQEDEGRLLRPVVID